jgi:4a-hydroxytetrahydrobiopterin dehydratase
VWLASWTTSRPALRTCASRCRRRATRTTNLLERLSVEERFREVLTFVQEISELAEAERHHPNIRGNATVSLQIKGLHENDFIMATKIDRIFAHTSAR